MELGLGPGINIYESTLKMSVNPVNLLHVVLRHGLTPLVMGQGLAGEKPDFTLQPWFLSIDKSTFGLRMSATNMAASSQEFFLRANGKSIACFHVTLLLKSVQFRTRKTKKPDYLIPICP